MPKNSNLNGEPDTTTNPKGIGEINEKDSELF
jgi:hypothetical protein